MSPEPYEAVPDPPGWGTDHLSTFTRDAQWNVKATAHNHRELYEVLRESLQLYHDFTQHPRETDGTILPAMLLRQAHSSFLGAAHMALATQAGEVYPLLRAALEAALYAHHGATSREAQRVFLERGHDDAARDACRREYTVRRVMDTLRAADAAVADRVHQHYNDLIDYGAHPNAAQLLTRLRIDDGESDQTFNLGYFAATPAVVAYALKQVAVTALVCLEVFRLVWPERMAIVGVDERRARLVARLGRMRFRADGSLESS